MTERSIYEVITDAIVDGALPRDFSLDQGAAGADTSAASHAAEPADQIRFADGAADGIAIYHMARPELPPDLHGSFERGIAQACVDDYEGANATFGELTRKHRAVEPLDADDRACLAAIANLAERQGWDELASACGALLGS